eukprot:5695805-Prymnesium_polylepis.3
MGPGLGWSEVLRGWEVQLGVGAAGAADLLEDAEDGERERGGHLHEAKLEEEQPEHEQRHLRARRRAC